MKKNKINKLLVSMLFVTGGAMGLVACGGENSSANSTPISSTTNSTTNSVTSSASSVATSSAKPTSVSSTVSSASSATSSAISSESSTVSSDVSVSSNPVISSTDTVLPPEIKTGTVTLDYDTTKGTIEASATSGNVGDTITLTVTPAKGYDLDTLTANGVDIKETKTFALIEGTNTVTATFKAQEISLKINEQATSYKVGDGATILELDFASGAGELTDVVWDESGLAGVGSLGELPADHPQKSDTRRFFTPVGAGNGGAGIVKVSAKVGETTYNAELRIVVETNASVTTISTAGDFLELVSKKGDISGNYALGANIDLGGAILNGRLNESNFLGILDGKGYTVSNFVIQNDTTDAAKEPQKATGMFYVFKGIMRNIHLKGSIDSDGFSGLVAKEAVNATFENCLFEAKNLRSTENWTWCRNGVITSVIAGHTLVKSCVTSLDAGETGAMCFPFFAYTWSGQQTLENLYTNIAHDETYENYTPFSPDGSCASPEGVHTNLSYADFATAEASTYVGLSSDIWTLADNAMPHLAHFGEEAVKLEAKLTASVDSTTLTLGGEKTTATISTEITRTSETASSYSFETDPADASAIATVANNNDGTFTVTAVGVGEVAVTVKATIGEKTISADPITIKVKDGATTPTYEKPENAVEINNLDDLKRVFNGSAESSTKNLYLANDIDCSSWTDAPNLGMAGEYTGIFEGAGHELTNLPFNQAAFNIIGATGQIQNLIATREVKASCFGGIGYMNNGTFTNVKVSSKVVSTINTFGFMTLAGNGTFVDCHVDIDFEEAGATSNALWTYTNAAPTLTNCTYSIPDAYVNLVTVTAGSVRV